MQRFMVLLTLMSGIALKADSISINFWNAAADPGDGNILEAGETAGMIRVDGRHWNNIDIDPAGPFSLVSDLRDNKGNPKAAVLTSTLASAHVSFSGIDMDNTVPCGNRDMMASYISWDAADDGVIPDDEGGITIAQLGEAFTARFYDVYVYCDADTNDRTFTITLNDRTRTLQDSSTFRGGFGLGGSGVEENYVLFRRLSASELTLSMDAGTGRGAVNALQIVAYPEAPPAGAVSINLYHTSATLPPDAWAGLVKVPNWNNVIVPGGAGTVEGSDGFGPIDLHDSNGQPAAVLSSNLQSHWNGPSGWTDAVKDFFMAEYISWDPAGDGVWPDDTGNMTITALAPALTDNGYDVIVYCDSDRNDRIFTVTVNGETKTGADAATFDGIFLPAGAADVEANYFLFENLTEDSFTLDVASNPGRAAVNGIQIIPNDFEPPLAPVPIPGDGPNLVVFMVDDMGWQDTSLPFHTSRTVWNDLYHTPNMERLARSGITFTNAHAACPVCSPTRVCLLTGKNPVRTGVTDWVGHGTSTNNLLSSGQWQSDGLQMTHGHWTLPAVLRDAGYRTAHVGKAHFGTGSGGSPTALGFDINIGGSHVGSPRGSGSMGAYFGPFGTLHPNMTKYGNNAYLTNCLTQEALNIMDQSHADGFPFFLHVAHYAVHTPLGGQGDPAFLPDYGELPNPEDDYAAMLASMDKSLGDVLDKLDALGIADNTLIVFTSDNGGLSNHVRANTADPSDPWARDRHNLPLRSGKGTAYEGGTRVPFIVAWAGQSPDGEPVQPTLPIQPGSQSTIPIHTQDLFPTLIAASGMDDASQFTADIDGQDISPILSGDEELFHRREPFYWHYPHQWVGDLGAGPGIEPFTSVRDGDWKALYFYSDQRWELYHLGDDIGETENLAASESQVLMQLGLAMLDWMKTHQAALPRLRRTLTLTANGHIYRNGQIRDYHQQAMTLNAGDEMPVILPFGRETAWVFTGDANHDGTLNLGDAVITLTYLFIDGQRPVCFKSADANDDDKVDLSDVITILTYLFTNGTMTAPDGTVLNSGNTGCHEYLLDHVQGEDPALTPPACGMHCTPWK